MILEYVLDEPSSFCLHIRRTSAGVSMLPAGRKQIEDLTDTYLDAVRLRKHTATKASGELFSILLDSILDRDSKQRLIIVLDGKLHVLPFECLTDSQNHYGTL
jgi:CHAT domain-containing protein